MNRLLPTLVIVTLSTGSFAAEWGMSDKPLEIPQGAAPNVMIIMDDSGSMDWEVMTGNFERDGQFIYNQPFDDGDDTDSDDNVPSSGPIKQRGACAVGTRYVYGVEFNSNAYDDGAGDCFLADKEAWRFRNSDFNPLYYNPDRTYTPWPGLSQYTSTNYPDGVPYSKLASELVASEPSASGFTLIGVDDPANPLEWLDLTQHSTSWDDTHGAAFVGAHTSVEVDGFSYYTWVDSNSNGFFDNWVDADFDGLFDDGEGDNVQQFKVTSLSAEKQQNFQNWFNFYRSREFSVKASLHFVLENMIATRVGYATLNSNSTTRDYDLEVETLNPNAEAVGSPKHNLYAKIDETAPSGGTPLRTTLRDVGEYFSCSSGTDSDGFVMNKMGAAACPYLTIDEGATCQQNYALLFSDGFWNGDSPNVGDTDAGSGKYKGGAFADSAGDPSNSWSDTLADVAMHYYETDLRTDLDDEVMVTNVDLAREPALDGISQMQQHMKTYTVAFGLELNNFDPDIFDKTVNETTVDWPNPTASKENKIKDMMHAAFNGRGEFYATRDDQVLTDNLADSFLRIFAEQSGAAGVSFNSQELKTGTYIFRAFYNPSTFDGDLVAITFDNNGKPLVDSPVWSASEQLDNVVAAGDRLIVSYDPDAKQGILFDYDAGLTATQQSWFETSEPTNRGASYGDADATWGDERVDFLWGDTALEGARFDKGELRDRDGLLGDFANSTPRYVGIPQGIKRDFEPYPVAIGSLYSEFKKKYINRADLVYAGANDGMLHGFNATNGREVFAFAPNKTMDDLYEFTLPSYIHEMSVDGSPGINDVFIKDGTEQWKTVLMGGYRAGGKGYYALDITDPTTFNQSQMPNNVMWEFTDADDDRLGLTFSTPNIVMSNAKYASGNHRWISLFGNGYNQSNANGESSLFALFVDGGLDGTWSKVSQATNYSNDDYIVMETGEGFITEGTDLFPNGLGTPRAIDTDANGTVDIVYAGDLAGNLYRFDLSDEDPSNWAMEEVLFTAQYEVVSGTYTRQPITVQPIVTHNDAGSGYLVVVSTGSWMTLDDITSTEVQSLYGIWDNLSTSYPMLASELIEQEFANVTSTLHNFTYRTLSNHLVPYKDSGKIGNRVMGWVINFDLCAAGNAGCSLPADAEYPGERGIRNLLIKEGVLFGVSILPSSNEACSDAPGGYLFSINSQSGGVVPEKPAFDLNDDGSFDDKDFADKDGDGEADDDEIPSAIRIDDGLPSDIAIIDGGGSDGSQVCYQTSTGELVCAGANVDSGYPQGKLSWKELAD